MNLPDRFQRQVGMLNAGDPLGAFDAFYADNVQMYDNDVLFAAGKAEGRAKQAPFIEAAHSIQGRIEEAACRALDGDVLSGETVFRNRSRFVTAAGKNMQIDGLAWQRWQNGLIVEERYYRNEMMAEKIKGDILSL